VGDGDADSLVAQGSSRWCRRVVTLEIGCMTHYWATSLSVTPDTLQIGVKVFWAGTRRGVCADVPTWQWNSWGFEGSGLHRV
jgi:hypothetical protein